MWYHGNKAREKRVTLGLCNLYGNPVGGKQGRESRISSRCPDSDSNELETLYRFWAI